MAATRAVVGGGGRGHGRANEPDGGSESVRQSVGGGGAGSPQGLLMDANRQRFWMIADEPQWTLTSGVQFSRDSRRVTLLNSRPLVPTAATANAALQVTANQRLALVPTAVDAFGTSASWDGAGGAGMG